MPDFSILLSSGSSIEQAPLPLYAFPARAWNTHEYRDLLASPAGAAMAAISEPGREVAWSGTTIEEMASGYAKLIAGRESGHRRPVALLGWSVGALVALETARQLQLQGRLAVAWVGVADGSTFSKLRQQLDEMPPLSELDRAPLELALAQWLERSPMREPWRELLASMNTAQRDYFLQEVGFHGEAMPVDGPQPDSQEHALWSRLNCLRLGLDYALPKALPAPVRWWRSEEMSTEPDELRQAFVGDPRCGRVDVIPGCDHLSLLAAPGFHQQVAQALAQRVPDETTPV